MKTVIDFVIQAAHDLEFRKEFVEFMESDPTFEKLQSFFKNKEYEVTDDECIRILENKEKINSQIRNKDY